MPLLAGAFSSVLLHVICGQPTGRECATQLFNNCRGARLIHLQKALLYVSVNVFTVHSSHPNPVPHFNCSIPESQKMKDKRGSGVRSFDTMSRTMASCAKDTQPSQTCFEGHVTLSCIQIIQLQLLDTALYFFYRVQGCPFVFDDEARGEVLTYVPTSMFPLYNPNLLMPDG